MSAKTYALYVNGKLITLILLTSEQVKQRRKEVKEKGLRIEFKELSESELGWLE